MKCDYLIAFLMAIATTGTTFAQAPKITSFSPAVGPVGTQVVIDGSGFNVIPDSNVVYFGAVHATVTSADASQLFVTVPVSATYQPITIINKTTRLSGQSAVAFRTTFSPLATDIDPAVRFAPASGIASVQLADIDGDGKPDIVATSPVNHTLLIFLNKSKTGKIDTSSFAKPVVYKTGFQSAIAAICDLDGDGKLDILLMNSGYSTVPNGNNSLSIFHNLSTAGHIDLSAVTSVDSTATTPASYIFQLKSGDKVTRAGDFNNDGKPDIAVLNTGGFISIYPNNYAEGQPLKSILGLPVAVMVATNPASFVTGDLDGDHKLDILTTNYGSSSLTFLRNNSTTDSLTASSFQVLDILLQYKPLAITPDDINGDGKPDVLISRSASESVYLFHNTSTPGNFDGTTINLSNVNALSNYNDDMVIQDINGDGKPDILSLNADLNTVLLYTNKSIMGQLSTDYFNNNVTFPITTIPDCIGDIDGDGRPDIVVGSAFGIDIYHSKYAAAQPVTTVTDNGSMSIYPNPASLYTNIKYDLPMQSAVVINVYDVVGRLLGTYNTGQESAGSHINELNTSNLQTGVYVIKITALGYGKTAKLIVL
jgi:hypothetical protein